MKSYLWLLTGLLGTGSGAHAATDLVNERLPATTLEREQHWNVDCVAIGGEILGWLDSRQQKCGAAPYATRIDRALYQLDLCGAIHNVPGEPRSCPDYNAAARLLRAWSAAACAPGEDNRESIRKQLQCTD
ncbi:MAG: hypothetical protein IPJ33_19685 [Gammaproteobacteria bacterium]|nr:hypothetical protein [Gammaproteobacteria bacterium]MBP6053411.1 hypothetical protein [Pseudomonadales bacterium]MBK6585184.1 hypothetical protein [Gammaproteobacteria bacterium]MBK7169061.1 hypothetical protein [Gammaproteobacteria bacterium]MBK7520093.1 hypothetical protein [Gammaproteobacteria bacterium]